MKTTFTFKDTDGSEYMLGFAHLLDIGDHAAYCMILRQLCPCKSATRSRKFWMALFGTVRQFTADNRGCLVYFCHYDTGRNLARIRLYLSKISASCSHEESSGIFVLNGKDDNGRTRHILVYMNPCNEEKEAILKTMQNNTDTFVRLHTECQKENNYLGFNATLI